MFTRLFLPLASIVALSGCIGTDIVDDAVDPELRIRATLDTLGFGESLQLEAMYLNRVGREEAVEFVWESSAPEVIDVTTEGLATAVSGGRATLTASYVADGIDVSDAIDLVAAEETVVVQEPRSRSGQINTTSSYVLTGGMTLTEQEGGGLLVEIADDYRASTALPGLYVYLTNNPRTTNGALEIGPVEVFSGAHSYAIPDVAIEDYSHLLYFCKPFNVKVGDGEFEAL